MEIRLHNNDRIHIQWIHPDCLAVEVYKPLNVNDGHGTICAGVAYLEGDALQQFLEAVHPAQQHREVA